MKTFALLTLGLLALPAAAVRCDPWLTEEHRVTARDVELATGVMNRHAVVAFSFAKQHGSKLYKKVFKRAKDVNVVIAMGGAEHLHHYLRARAHYAGRSDVKFYPLYITRDMVYPWNALETALPYPSTETRREFGREEIRSLTGQAERVLEFVGQSGVLDGGDIVVVDTGFNGTIVEVIASAVEHFDTRQRVRGVLLAHNPPEVVVNTVPIEALGSARAVERELFTPRWWAFFLEDGPPDMSPYESDEALPEELRYWASYEPGGLQRSAESPKRLIRVRGQWGPNTEPFESREVVRKWKDAVVGMTLAARAHAKVNSPTMADAVAEEIQTMSEDR